MHSIYYYAGIVTAQHCLLVWQRRDVPNPVVRVALTQPEPHTAQLSGVLPAGSARQFAHDIRFTFGKPVLV